MSGEKNKPADTIHLFGDFRKAHVFVGDGNLFGLNKSLSPEVFEEPFHDEVYKGVKYRFINPEKMTDSDSIEALKEHKDSYVFAGDTDGLLIEITKGGIRSQFMQELKGTRDDPKASEGTEAQAELGTPDISG